MTWTQLKLLPSELYKARVSHLKKKKNIISAASWFGMEKEIENIKFKEIALEKNTNYIFCACKTGAMVQQELFLFQISIIK
jgi:hypothetical protein